jgi:5-formaminoimidazole-4-carboxamide-1-(beta)-D-ribofuranosyl 5'-monophosphate synthetase
LISKDEIDKILKRYKKYRIATICSHSALQIFHGAKLEGFETIGICQRDRKKVYDSFPQAKPDEYILVDDFKEILNLKVQNELIKKNSIVIAHGSFVEYVGPRNLEEKFFVPMFGNRKTLEWERDRKKQKAWLEKAGLITPKEYKSVREAGGKAFVKFSGAKGGKGFFTADSDKDLSYKLREKVRNGIISNEDAENITIQEFIPGVRFYPHFFYSIFEDNKSDMREGRIELLSMDKRIEPIDESYRGLPNIPEEFFDYTVTGNQPIIVRESFLPIILKMGRNVVNTSKVLFPPGMQGAFCLETIYHPRKSFIVFEVSARIVAGTNLYPLGSPYSFYIFKEPMSTGRRIAREIKIAITNKKLSKVIY